MANNTGLLPSDQDSDSRYAPEHDNLGVSSSDAQREVSDLENLYHQSDPLEDLYNADSAPDRPAREQSEAGGDQGGGGTRTGSGNADSADDLAGREDDTVGEGYTKPQENPRRAKLNKTLAGNSKLKKRVAIAGAFAGGSAVCGIIIFLVMLPLKIEHVVENLQNTFAATTDNALEAETETLFNGYVKNSIIPSLAAGTCHNTIDPSCVVTPGGTGPVKQLYAAWSKGRFENKLATNYGIVIAKKNNKFYLNLDGKDIDLAQVRTGKVSIFDLGGTNSVSRSEIRTTLNKALKDGTLWDKTYGRFKLGKYLEQQFGIKRCIIACNIRDEFTDKIASKQLAAKLFIAQRVITPLGGSYGVFVTCILSPDDCDTKLSVSTSSDVKTSALSDKLDGALNDYIAQNGTQALKDLIGKAGDINKLGLGGYLAKVVAEKIADTLGGDGAKVAAGAAVSKAVPIVGWVSLALGIVKTAETIGPATKALSYASHAAAAASLYMTYRTVASEALSGHTDATELGSFTNELSTSSDLGKTKSDMTDTPLYNDLFGSGSASTPNTSYKCNDGSPVPAGKTACPEEDFSNAGGFINVLSATTEAAPIQAMLKVSNIVNYPLTVAQKIYNTVTGYFGGAITSLCKITPGCSQGLDWASGVAASAVKWIYDELIPNPFADLSGGRAFDMLAAGADVSNNAACQALLGCAKLTNTQVALQRNKQATEVKQEFDSQSMFARVFSTSSPFSLVSRLAMDMPTSILTATNDGLASVLSNPLGKLSSVFSSMFSSNHAFAVNLPSADPFGVTQFGYPTVPKDAQTYWDSNCASDYDASTMTLDTSDWTDKQVQDPKTLQAVSEVTNPCMLELTAIQNAGEAFDASMIPPGDANADPGASSTPVGNNGVYQIGDGLTTGLKSAGSLVQKFSSKGLDASQVDSSDGLTIAGAITKLNADQANIKLADVIVIQLGAADSGASLTDDQQGIDNLVHALHSDNPTATIYWMNVASSKVDVSTINAAISSRAVSGYYDVIDWNDEATTNPANYTFASDGTLLAKPAGYANLAAFEISQIAEAGA